ARSVFAGASQRRSGGGTGLKQRVFKVALLLGMCSGTVAAQKAPAQTPQTAGPTANSGGRTLTLQEAEAIAVQKNPQITVGKLQVLEAREFVREARAAMLPQAGLSVTAVDTRAAAGASVSQLITDFGRTQNLVSSSAFSAKAQDENAIATRQQIVLAVDEAFYNTLETKALLHVAEETVSARQNLVDQIQALTNAKLRSDIDLSFSKVNLARAKLLLLESQNNYEASLSTLSAILAFS